MKLPTKVVSRFACILLILCLLFPVTQVRAEVKTFNDDFNTINFENWNVLNNNGSVSIVDPNIIKLSSNSNVLFPYVYSKLGMFPKDEYTVDTSFSLEGPLNFGYGMVFSDTLISIGSSHDLEPNDIIFQIWPDSQSSAGLWTSLCPELEPQCANNTYRKITSFQLGSFHKLKLNFNNNKYEISIDSEIPKTFIASRIISYFWFGSYQQTNTLTQRPSVFVDYFKISTPSPVKEPVVILPGFGGSWDVGAVLNNTAGNNWKIPPFVKNYDGIIQSFKNAGYVEGTNLFVFGYDWRKKLTDLADDLNTFINNSGISKINLVGHSMGGLVARSYAQKYGVSKVDKILTIGTPHLGLIDMYGLWEGAKIWDGAWWQNALLEINSEVNRNPGETKVTALRRNSPSIIDLYPTFPFLFFNGGLKNIDTMVQQNLYLKDLNSNFGVLGSKLTPFWSEDIPQTKNKINTVDRLTSDATLERWEDGRPANIDTFGNIAGDGTVTKESAIGPFGPGEKLVGWHGDLLANIDNNKKVLTKLGLDSSFASASGTTDNRKYSFVALLHSPGKLEVCDENKGLCNENLGGILLESGKLYILPGYAQEDLTVKVKEDGFGDYKLYTGNIDEEPDWQIRSGWLTQTNQVDRYYVSSDGENIKTKQDNIISFESLDGKTFGDADFTINATASSGLSVAFGASGNCTVTTNIVHITSAGSCTITASQMGNELYKPATNVAKTFTINKTTLTISADNKSRQYSDPNPVLTYKTSSSVGFTGKPTCATPANINSPAGSYLISCSKGSLASTNYNFVFVDGIMKVEKEKAEILYVGDRLGFTWGKNKTTNIDLGAMLFQEVDRYFGDLRLAKVYFEVSTKNGAIVATTNAMADRFGFARTKLSGLRPGDYSIRVWIDTGNSFWRNDSPEVAKIRILAL